MPSPAETELPGEGFDAVVIGSGPSGVAATSALVRAGRRVLVLEGGDGPLPEHTAQYDALGSSEPEAWDPTLLEAVRGGFAARVRSVPLRPAYGSLYPYAVDDPNLVIEQDGAELVASLARGGLSNTWGCAVLPWRAEDLAGWPITLEDLEPHYRAVLEFLPLSGAHDDLEEEYPFYTEQVGSLPRAPQAEATLGSWTRHRGALGRAGFRFGSSRLAVRTGPGDDRRCRRCGLCLYGCPYHSMYNSADTLADLVHAGGVSVRSGVFVTRLAEDADSVRVTLADREGRSAGSLLARRVFVAAGSLPSTQLIARSLGLNAAIRLHDSQYFLLPMLRAAHVSVRSTDRVTTLAQAFLELDDPAVASRRAHLQLYGYSDSVLKALAAGVPLSSRTLERLAQPLLGRLVILQGFLHSADSAALDLTVRDAHVHVEVVGKDEAADAVRRLVRALRRSQRSLGMTPLSPVLQIGAPAKSFHTGASFPMASVPSATNSDPLGRIGPLRRVHVVDTAVLPEICGTTITFTAMANAHRIASAIGAGAA